MSGQNITPTPVTIISIAVASDGTIVVLDSADRVLRIDPSTLEGEAIPIFSEDYRLSIPVGIIVIP